MAQVEQGRFLCDGCGKSYRWKNELAGKKVKCKCGAVMICPADEPASQDDLYDIAPDADAPLKKSSPAVAVAPAIPMHAQVAAAAARPAQAKAPPLAYRNPRVEKRAVDDYFPDKTKDLYAPLWLIGGSTVVLVVATMMSLRAGSRSLPVALTFVGVRMIFGTIFMLLGVLAAAKMRGISFGPFWTAVLKLAAISIAPDAFTELTGRFFRVIPLIGPVINWIVGFCLYFALIGALFDLDQSDTWYCVCVIFLVKLAIFFALFFGILGFIMHA